MEMLLSSLFTGDYIPGEQVLIANNGLIEYIYIKNNHGYDMKVRLVSLEEPTEKFRVSFGGDPFKINMRNIADDTIDISGLLH